MALKSLSFWGHVVLTIAFTLSAPTGQVLSEVCTTQSTVSVIFFFVLSPANRIKDILSNVLKTHHKYGAVSFLKFLIVEYWTDSLLHSPLESRRSQMGLVQL